MLERLVQLALRFASHALWLNRYMARISRMYFQVDRLALAPEPVCERITQTRFVLCDWHPRHGSEPQLQSARRLRPAGKRA